MNSECLINQNASLQHIFSPKFLLKNNYINHLVGRILHAILPKTWFCWISRGSIQLQSFLRPNKYSYWTKISDKIYLGAMPLKNKDHLNKITQLGVKAILSINEDYEFDDQFLAEPVKPLDWQKKNIKILRISSPDMVPVEIPKLTIAIDFVARQVIKGKSVYVHCTAGRSRSASVVIGSLIRIENYSLENALRHVQNCRPQVIISQQQMKFISDYTTTLSLESQRQKASQIHYETQI